MKKEQKGELSLENRKVADKVADELLSKDFKSDKRFLIFLLIFVMLLTFLISSVSFAILNSYNQGSSNNTINAGSVLFSFNEDSNYIKILDASPTKDEVGKTFTSPNHYFDFSVSVGYSRKAKKEKLNYEISLVPLSGNTLSSSYVRVYLTENDKDVILTDSVISNFSDLKDSKIKEGAKVLLHREVNSSMVNNYRLRLWLSDKYELSEKALEFKCKVAINTYAN